MIPGGPGNGDYPTAGGKGEPVLASEGASSGHLLPIAECKISHEGSDRISALVRLAKKNIRWVTFYTPVSTPQNSG
jgi:hypothetical protein